jgi:hypothetical protein
MFVLNFPLNSVLPRINIKDQTSDNLLTGYLASGVIPEE